MKKWIKRLLLAGVLVVLILVGLTTFAWHLKGSRPVWYPKGAPDRAAVEAAANRMNQKLAGVQGWIADTSIYERSRNGSRAPVSTDPTTAPAKDFALVLTADELNAFFSNWDKEFHWGDRFNKYVTDPVLVIQGNRLILAGEVKEADTVLSIHLEPKIDDKGMLHLEIVKVMGGMLPLPQSFWERYRQKLLGAMENKIDQQRTKARLHSDGSMNTEGIAVEMNDLLIHALNGEPADPVLFLPVAKGSGLPVKVTDISVKDAAIRMTMVPLTPEERQTLLQHIRDGGDALQAQGKPDKSKVRVGQTKDRSAAAG
jgi:hypothetical protein